MIKNDTIRFIVVEDEDLILNSLVKKIETMDPAFKVMGTAQDGRSALKLFEQVPVDVLITDIQMPVMNGLELLKEVDNLYPSTKKIILSGYNEFEYAKQALKLGVLDYLLKPIKNEEFKKVLTQLKWVVGYDRNLLNVPSLNAQDEQSQSPKEIVELVQRYLKENFQKDLSLELISKKFNFNPSYLSKIFIKHTGQPPSKFLITLRINEAKHLLASQPEQSVKDIGEHVGYPNPYYFSRIFKQITGVTPTEYRHIINVQ